MKVVCEGVNLTQLPAIPAEPQILLGNEAVAPLIPLNVTHPYKLLILSILFLGF